MLLIERLRAAWGRSKRRRRHRLIDRALDEELPRYKEALRRLGE
jgi:hypothetical protein